MYIWHKFTKLGKHLNIHRTAHGALAEWLMALSWKGRGCNSPASSNLVCSASVSIDADLRTVNEDVKIVESYDKGTALSYRRVAKWPNARGFDPRIFVVGSNPTSPA